MFQRYYQYHQFIILKWFAGQVPVPFNDNPFTLASTYTTYNVLGSSQICKNHLQCKDNQDAICSQYSPNYFFTLFSPTSPICSPGLCPRCTTICTQYSQPITECSYILENGATLDWCCSHMSHRGTRLFPWTCHHHGCRVWLSSTSWIHFHCKRHTSIISATMMYNHCTLAMEVLYMLKMPVNLSHAIMLNGVPIALTICTWIPYQDLEKTVHVPACGMVNQCEDHSSRCS